MKRECTGDSGGMRTCRPTNSESWCELLILVDGTVLAQNLTQELAEILKQVAPRDSSLRERARRRKKANIEQSTSNVNHGETEEQ